MGKEKKMFNMRDFWGDSRKMPFVVFGRKTDKYCIYCGDKADTREHCPPQAFLNPPLPSDLPTLPACFACNNGFSADEKYVKHVIENLYCFYEKSDNSFLQPLENERREITEAREAAKKFIVNPYYDDRMARVFCKIAIGHAVFELSEIMFNKSIGDTVRISYGIRPMYNDHTWNEMVNLEDITNEILPEVGSRAMENIFVVSEYPGRCDDDSVAERCLINWTSLQSGYYKYLAFFKDERICVKMLFRDFLIAEIIFCG